MGDEISLRSGRVKVNSSIPIRQSNRVNRSKSLNMGRNTDSSSSGSSQQQNPPQNQTHTGYKAPMPVFKHDDVVAWFRRLEHWFDLQRIVEENDRYSFLASQLDHPAITYMPEWIDRPQLDPYKVVKERIITIFADSTQERVQKLLAQKPLGDLKPSLLLAEMRNIATGVNEDVLRNLWANRLPHAARTVLAVLEKQPLDEAARAADSVMESINTAAKVNEVNSIESNNFNQLTTSIQQLTKTFADFKNQNKQRQRSENRDDNKVSRSRSKSKHTDGICFYHRKYAEKAKRCVLPCSYEPKPKN